MVQTTRFNAFWLLIRLAFTPQRKYILITVDEKAVAEDIHRNINVFVNDISAADSGEVLLGVSEEICEHLLKQELSSQQG